ncbi:MAG: NUDIX domain-containing protein [Devosia sp.]
MRRPHLQAHAKGGDKVCPVLLRNRDGVLDILAFKHPLAGCQLVKGGIERGETVLQAARREVFEESGMATEPSGRHLGVWYGAPNPWHMIRLDTAEALPDRWEHHCADDGGHVFSFFWWPLDQVPGAGWHVLYREALAFIRLVIQQD